MSIDLHITDTSPPQIAVEVWHRTPTRPTHETHVFPTLGHAETFCETLRRRIALLRQYEAQQRKESA